MHEIDKINRDYQVSWKIWGISATSLDINATALLCLSTPKFNSEEPHACLIKFRSYPPTCDWSLFLNGEFAFYTII